VYEDNDGAVILASNPNKASHRIKHIVVRHHYTRELVDARITAVISIPTSDMLTDGITKALPQCKHTILFKRCVGSYAWNMMVNDLERISQYIGTCTC
jgi:hypothetical protein